MTAEKSELTDFAENSWIILSICKTWLSKSRILAKTWTRICCTFAIRSKEPWVPGVPGGFAPRDPQGIPGNMAESEVAESAETIDFKSRTEIFRSICENFCERSSKISKNREVFASMRDLRSTTPFCASFPNFWDCEHKASNWTDFCCNSAILQFNSAIADKGTKFCSICWICCRIWERLVEFCWTILPSFSTWSFRPRKLPWISPWAGGFREK